MKILHCADIHLDSPMRRLSTNERISERKAELIKAFTSMVEYAKKQDVEVVIIAGDLFDTSKVSASAKNAVIDSINKNQQIDFYFLKGNHDKIDIFNDEENIPKNLHLFSDEWQSYDLGENIVLTGVELTKNNASNIYSALSLDVSKFNIVTLHGQESKAAAKDDAQVISMKDLKSKNIDYLALGHIHTYKCEKLDARGTYCYTGCLEARGYDEAGEHGFVILDVDGSERKYSIERINQSIRNVHIVDVDVSGSMSSSDITDKIRDELYNQDYPKTDLVKVNLVGELDVECEKNLNFIEKTFEDDYFAFKLDDSSKLKVNYDEFRLDESLKGEFIRAVEADNTLSSEDKAEIIKTGISALMGEGVK